MKKFNVGLFVQETRSIDVEAESQEDAEQKVRDIIAKAGTEEDDAIQLYNESDTTLEVREIEVFADKRLIVFDSPEDMYLSPEEMEELRKQGDIPLLDLKNGEVE